MTLIKTRYNRRSFIKISAATSGGLVIGFNWLTSCTPAGEDVLGIPEEWFTVNAHIEIGDNGLVTIFSPNPEIGQNVKTSMPMIVAEELDIDWKHVRVVQAGLDTEKYRRQVAGGSQSIRASWDGLRMAGATARRMLMEAAAKQWNVPVSELSTSSGIISHSDGRKAGYGEMASVAVGIEVPEEVELKDPRDFRIIGVATRNVDGLGIVTGKPLFGLDVDREGMKIAMIVRAPAFGMTLASLDDSGARAMPGITDVFVINTAPPEADKQEMVAIVGNSTWEVMKGRNALKIEWEAGKLESSGGHEQEMAELLSGKAEKPARTDGDVDLAFRNAAQVIERTYTAPFLAHNTMEPMNFFADVKEGKAELVGPIQTPEWMRGQVAEVTGIPAENISIMMTRQGGGFGRRLYGNFGVEAAIISQKAGVPVKLIYTREDDMTQGTYRPAYRVSYKAALDEGNNLIGFHIKGTGIHGSPVFQNRYPAGTVDNYLVENFTLDSNITTGAWRAPRSNFIAGAEQSFLDEVAEAAGKDPIEFRLELFERAVSDPVGEDNDYDPERYAGVLKLIREKAGWGMEQEGVFRGVSAYFCHNSYVAQVVDVVKVGDGLRVKKVWSAVDCGIVVNPEGARNQVEGGITDGIGHAMYGALTFTDGRPDQQNFHNYRLIRQAESPMEIETHFVESTEHPTGLGEPGLPPAIGALANAVYRATGKRLYAQPFGWNDAGIKLDVI